MIWLRNEIQYIPHKFQIRFIYLLEYNLIYCNVTYLFVYSQIYLFICVYFDYNRIIISLTTVAIRKPEHRYYRNTFDRTPRPVLDMKEACNQQTSCIQRILDLDGRILLSENVDGRSIRKEIPDAIPNVYLLNVLFKNGSSTMKRMVRL